MAPGGYVPKLHETVSAKRMPMQTLVDQESYLFQTVNSPPRYNTPPRFGSVHWRSSYIYSFRLMVSIQVAASYSHSVGYSYPKL